MGLLRSISGLCCEDIATEIVAHMLSTHDAHVPFQKLFFGRVLGLAKSSSQLEVEAKTQPSFELGQPDLVVLTEGALIVVETKLGAHLSGDDQLVRYCELFENNQILRYFPLAEREMVKTKSLVLLAPSSILRLSVAATDRQCQKKYGEEFERWLENRKIRFIPLSWEELVTDLDNHNAIEEELRILVTDFTNQEFNKEERMALNNSAVPAALIKLFKGIEDMRDQLLAEGIKTGRISQSYNYYGFYIKAVGLKLWFGYYLPIWENHKTPVFLQVCDAWIDEIHREKIMERLKVAGFERDPKAEFIKPFNLENDTTWKDDLVQLIGKISEILKPPR